MQIGLRLHDSAKLELNERLKTVKGQGFSCVHLALSKIEGLVSSADALTPGYAMYLRHTFEQAGLDIAVLGNYLNLAHPDRDKLDEMGTNGRKYLDEYLTREISIRKYGEKIAGL